MKIYFNLVVFVFLSLIMFCSQLQAGRCQAITKKGTQCKRQAEPGSIYCWQHGGRVKLSQSEINQTTESDSINNQEIIDGKKGNSKKSDTIIGTTSSGQTLYQGPRGGIYHYSKSGKKVYHKKK